MVYAGSGVEDVSIYGAIREDGILTVRIVNLADVKKQIILQVTGGLSGQAELWRLDQENIPETAVTLVLAPDGALALPAQSVSLLVFE